MIINRTPVPPELQYLFTDILLLILVEGEYVCVNSDKEENANALIKQHSAFNNSGVGSWFYKQRYLTTPTKIYLFSGREYLQVGELIDSIQSITNELKRNRTEKNYRLNLPKKHESLIYSGNMKVLPDNVFINLY
jgi:hypothetical protein